MAGDVVALHPDPSALVEITVYGKPACQQCRMSCKHLERNEIPFRYCDVTEDDDAHRTVDSLGYRSLPVVTAGDMHWSGFRNDKLRQLAVIHSSTTDISHLDIMAKAYLEVDHYCADT